MDILKILELINAAAKIGTIMANGGPNATLETLTGFEQMAISIAQQYKALAGKPLDVSLLTYEEPIN